MADWLVAVAERVGAAIENLSEAGYAVYAPRYRERRGRLWRDHWLLGRYLLVERHGGWGTQFHLVIRLVGVREVLRYENEWPLVVREREVAELRARENRHGYVVMTPVPEPFARRAKVRIVGGVLDGRVARYMGEQRGKCRVEVDMLGRVVNLVVPEENLVAA